MNPYQRLIAMMPAGDLGRIRPAEWARQAQAGGNDVSAPQIQQWISDRATELADIELLRARPEASE